MLRINEEGSENCRPAECNDTARLHQTKLIWHGISVLVRPLRPRLLRVLTEKKSTHQIGCLRIVWGRLLWKIWRTKKKYTESKQAKNRLSLPVHLFSQTLTNRAKHTKKKGRKCLRNSFQLWLNDIPRSYTHTSILNYIETRTSLLFKRQ